MSEKTALIGRWRVGRHVGRTIYWQRGPEPSDDDPLIGVMDHPDLARAAVDQHNMATAPADVDALDPTELECPSHPGKFGDHR